MVNDPNQLVYDFRLSLDRFGAEVEEGALNVFRQSAEIAAQAIVLGNPFGTGVPIDTGFAASSFGIGINEPYRGPTEPPLKLVKNKGLGQIHARQSLSAEKATLGDTVYVNTMAGYPQHLEFTPKKRRFGKNKGKSTEFIDPVEVRWTQIVDDAAKRVGYGA